MTQTQKTQIRIMRMQGMGYHVIAKELCLKENQVQLFCKTHGLAGESNLVRLNYPIWCEQNSRCLVCGSKIEQLETGRKKKFCSGRCRTRYGREQHEQED